ncbi:phosphatidylserine/phosphatidylglycerophosphate/cardiolipin synthase family protein [Altererythrobacter sp. MTPC7]|uniref:phospholipase D-like domain-containing protein n=1 Tax=Altererythrobacter sp. MTPC7 TaxID=3056567 RepID=UPI0036F39ACF
MTDALPQDTTGAAPPVPPEEYSDPPSFSASVDGLDLWLYPRGGERLEALLALVEGAKRSLKLCFYIFAEDDVGKRMRSALTQAAKRGVKATLIVDGFGAEADARFFRDFTAAGGDFRVFSSRASLRYLIRNHQKIALADDARAIVGGFNIADDYFAPPTDNGWNDLAVWLEGRAVSPLVDWYDNLLEWTDSDGVEWKHVRHAVREWDAGAGAVRWLMGGPTRKLSSWARTVGRDLENGRRLDLMMAYFSPPKRLLRKIGKIAQRGQANLVMAGKSDNAATIGASRSLYDYLLHKGADVYEFDACKMHTKLLVLDDAVYLGSANFDMRSLYINLEIVLRVEDAAFADRMREFIASHLPASLDVTPQVHRRRNTLWNRIRWNFSWFLVGVMDYTVSRRLNLGL